MRLHPALLGLIFIALAAAFFGWTFTFPAFAGQRYGPELFPRVIALGIAACALVLLLRGWRQRGRGTPWFTADPALREARGLASFLAMLGAVVFYLLAAERLGFLPTAALIVGALAGWFGARWWVALLTGVAAAALVQWFFGSLMRVPLPRGWFMQIVAGG
jgi:putative tricarboxylic transport membrane protein